MPLQITMSVVYSFTNDCWHTLARWSWCVTEAVFPENVKQLLSGLWTLSESSQRIKKAEWTRSHKYFFRWRTIPCTLPHMYSADSRNSWVECKMWIMTEENTVRINAQDTVDSFSVKCVYDYVGQHRLDLKIWTNKTKTTELDRHNRSWERERVQIRALSSELRNPHSSHWDTKLLREKLFLPNV